VEYRSTRHIPESLGSRRRGQLLVRDRGNGLKAQPAVYRWTNGAGWITPTSCELMKMKAVNREPVIRPEGTLALQGGEEVGLLRYIKRAAVMTHPVTSPLSSLNC
jgi:putative transposase